MYLLGGAGGQELQVVPFVARNTPGQEDGISPGIRLDELHHILLLSVS